MNYEKKILIKKEIIKRTLPKSLNSKEKKLFYNDKVNHIPDFYLIKLTNVIINKNGLPILKNKELINDYLDISGISTLKFIKKNIILIRYYTNIFFDKLFNFHKFKFINEAIFVNNRHSYGYAHWVCDILPKLIYINKDKILKKRKIIINLPYNKFHKDYVNKIGRKKFFLQKKNTYIKIKNFYYLSKIHNSGNPRPSSVFSLRKFFLKKNKKPYRKVYISRKFANKRVLENDDIFCEYLKEKGFEIHFFEKYSVSKQINIVSNSKTLIGFSGAGLINTLWLPKLSSLIDIRPETDSNVNVIFSISNIIGVNYNIFLCKKSNLLKSNHYSNFKINIEKFDKKFNKKIY